MKNNFYITTTLPYVNAEPHIGFAKEIIIADVIARWKRLTGQGVFFNTGTDEHGLKIYEKALEVNLDPQKYADKYAEKFRALKENLNLSFNSFIRTTDERHISAASEFWRRCEKSGDIYKRNYKIKYCVGCELEKTDSELAGGRCSIHPNKEIEIIEEENYFFRFSKYGGKLLELYKSQPDFVLPGFRLNEIKMFVESGLQDFSISRLKNKMPWGIKVPGDESHVMYVWFDALVSYISALGWPGDEESFNNWWPGVQVAGKDNLRQQSAMWQTMLMSAGLPPSKQILILGFITSDGQKMSKSIGNVIDPIEIVEDYGIDALRYFLIREITTYEDGDFTAEKFKEAYNANLANGLGNLVSRIMKMSSVYLTSPTEIPDDTIPNDFKKLMDNYEIQKAADYIWKWFSALDFRIQNEEPFKLIKSDNEKAKKIIKEMRLELYTVARMLNPFMPETSDAIKELVKKNSMPPFPIFPRKS